MSERKGFSIRKVLFVIIIIIVLTWIFPLKHELEEKLDPLYQSTFNKNINLMKESAKIYFDYSRLPDEVGETSFLTLGDMFEKNLLTLFLDSQNNPCDINHSYIEITKMDEGYYLKINLQCSDKSDYVIVYMGCYNYCNTTSCETKEI